MPEHRSGYGFLNKCEILEDVQSAYGQHILFRLYYKGRKKCVRYEGGIMKKKRMFAAGMLAIMIALTAGCGSAHGGQTNGKGTISSTQKTAGTEVKDGVKNELQHSAPYNYLAIGNSVTHWDGKPEERNKIWWSDYGMAADRPENDYVHLVAAHLSEKRNNVEFQSICFQDWETNEAGDRDSYLKDLDDVLSEDLDLITVQLGENITEDTPVTVKDYTNLIDYLKKEAPDAKIIFLGQILWNNDEVQSIKQQAAAEYGIPFINLDDVRTGAQYQAGMGTQVLGDDGELHAINNEVVAAHPNNSGMQVIADRIDQTVDTWLN